MREHFTQINFSFCDVCIGYDTLNICMLNTHRADYRVFVSFSEWHIHRTWICGRHTKVKHTEIKKVKMKTPTVHKKNSNYKIFGICYALEFMRKFFQLVRFVYVYGVDHIYSE